MKTHEHENARMSRSRRPRQAMLALAVAAGMSLGTAQAAQINYQVELVTLHSNNLNLSEDNQASETVFIPRLLFDVHEEGAKVRLQARGGFERRNYAGNRFPDENRSEFAGQLNWMLLPERLNFVFEDYLGEESINLREGRYPGNLQRINIFLAGPATPRGSSSTCVAPTPTPRSPRVSAAVATAPPPHCSAT